MCPQVTFSVWISELFFSRAKHTSFHFHWQLQTEATFWNTGIHLKFHFHFSEIIQISLINTEPSQQSELFSILLWRSSWFWLFTRFGAIKSPRLRLGLFIAPKWVKSQNQLPFHTIKTWRAAWKKSMNWATFDKIQMCLNFRIIFTLWIVHFQYGLVKWARKSTTGNILRIIYLHQVTPINWLNIHD